MTDNPAHQSLRDSVVSSLVDTGYSVLPTPLKLGEISLDVELVFSGPNDRLDLAVIVDRPESREEALRLYWQIQRIARALDAVGSRRTITVVIIGGIDDNRLLADLQSIARVLTVDESLPVRRLIAPLLNLELPAATQATLDGMAQVRTSVKGRYSAPLLGIVESAPDGSAAIKASYASWVEEAFAGKLRRGTRHG